MRDNFTLLLQQRAISLRADVCKTLKSDRTSLDCVIFKEEIITYVRSVVAQIVAYSMHTINKNNKAM